MGIKPLILVCIFFGLTALASIASAQGQEPVIPLPEYSPTPAEALPTLSLHGGAYFNYYRPNQSWADEDANLYYAYIVLDSTYTDWGLRLEGRGRDTTYQDFFASNFWFQESYLYYRHPLWMVKIGKEYSHFGRFWDGSMYGNVLAFDGMILSPDDGFSLEGHLPDSHAFGLNYFFQYFMVDGQTNASLDGQHSGATITGVDIDPGCDYVNYQNPPSSAYRPCYQRTGRDTISVEGGRRRNEIIGRLEPNFNVGNGKITVGFSYMFLLADLTTLPPPPNAPQITPGRYNVHRYEYDVSYDHGPFSIFLEFAHQHGQTVLDYPEMGNPSQKIFYYWAGIRYKIARWTLYYNYSEAIYDPYNLHNVVQVPGFMYDINKYLQFIFEYGYMYRLGTIDNSIPGGDPNGFYINDNSMNFYLKGSI